jgi:heat shock protein HslJ
MRSLSLTLLAVAALLAPAVAMAATPAAPPAATARYFEIRGLVLGGTKLDAGGKLAVEGSKFVASAGCNMIGGEVRVGGESVTFVGPTFMTEMACPGANGDAEALLIKILALGTFKITDGGWLADGGEIVTVEIPASTPGPVGSPPDEPVTTGPIATIIDPAPGGPTRTCPPVPANYGTNPVDGGPAGGPISGGGSGPETEPAATANDLPLETGSVDPQPPAPPNPGETFPVGQPDPDPGFTGKDPNVGKPLVDPCYGVSLGAGQVEPDVQAAPKAAGFDASATRDAAVASPGLVLPMAFGIMGLVLAGVAVDRRRRVGQ